MALFHTVPLSGTQTEAYTAAFNAPPFVLGLRIRGRSLRTGWRPTWPAPSTLTPGALARDRFRAAYREFEGLSTLFVATRAGGPGYVAHLMKRPVRSRPLWGRDSYAK